MKFWHKVAYRKSSALLKWYSLQATEASKRRVLINLSQPLLILITP